MIRLENVCKTYGEGDCALDALKNINLEIPDGKFVAIIGESGSGKSTLLNMIGSLDNPTSGKIVSDGLCLTELSENELSDYRNKNIGFIFQAFYLEPYYTVFENVEMPLVIAGVDKAARREAALNIIEKVGLKDKTDKKVNTLSGGQKQRVSIARAMVHSPKVILADEPTGNLDSKNGAEIIALLQKLRDGGRTVILVTHNLADARNADCIVEITDGEITAVTDAGARL